MVTDEIANVLLQPGSVPKVDNNISVFDSTGLAIQDISVAFKIYKRICP
jgi:ornithine cyclodeaminase/alanine dehydrogenase-like protein (mu-crystallin family)